MKIRLIFEWFRCLVSISFDLCSDDVERHCWLASKE